MEEMSTPGNPSPVTPPRPSGIVTFLSDFGLTDTFVAEVKGRILCRDPRLILVDLTHDIPPFDIEAGAWRLSRASGNFPPETVHLAMVDPGGGDSRRSLVCRSGDQWFVGPDNGLLTFACSRPDREIYEIRNDAVTSRCPVFLARDLFAPMAADLASGKDWRSRVERSMQPPVILQDILPSTERGCTHGTVIDIDRFGNIATNLAYDMLQVLSHPVICLNNIEIRDIIQNYQQGKYQKTYIIRNSYNEIEICSPSGSAAEQLGIRKKMRVFLREDS